jgi:hypothetical protein
MRGRVIEWDGSHGAVAVGEALYQFEGAIWQGPGVPALEMVVEVTMRQGQPLAIAPAMTPAVALGQDAPATRQVVDPVRERGGEIVNGILDSVGKDVLSSYVAFAVSALFLGFISGAGMATQISVAMTDILGGATGGSAGGVILVLAAIATIGVPFFWRDTRAYLTLSGPLIVTLIADYRVYRLHAAAQEQLERVENMFSGTPGKGLFANFASTMHVGVSLGVGFYVCLAAASYAAYRGIRAFLRARVAVYSQQMDPPLARPTPVKDAPAPTPSQPTAQHPPAMLSNALASQVAASVPAPEGVADFAALTRAVAEAVQRTVRAQVEGPWQDAYLGVRQQRGGTGPQMQLRVRPVHGELFLVPLTKPVERAATALWNARDQHNPPWKVAKVSLSAQGECNIDFEYVSPEG